MVTTAGVAVKQELSWSQQLELSWSQQLCSITQVLGTWLLCVGTFAGVTMTTVCQCKFQNYILAIIGHHSSHFIIIFATTGGLDSHLIQSMILLTWMNPRLLPKSER